MRASLILLLATAAVGCGHVQPPHRTLPDRIESIHIPMPRNESFEYGLEEHLARALHEEFLADGRLRIARANEADARVEVTITDFGAQVQSVNSDDYPLFDTADIEADVLVTEPLRDEATVRTSAAASYTYISDPRRSEFVPEPVWRQELLQGLALEIVHQVISGYQDDGGAQGPQGDIDLDATENRRVPTVGGSSLAPR